MPKRGRYEALNDIKEVIGRIENYNEKLDNDRFLEGDHLL